MLIITIIPISFFGQINIILTIVNMIIITIIVTINIILLMLIITIIPISFLAKLTPY